MKFRYSHKNISQSVQMVSVKQLNPAVVADFQRKDGHLPTSIMIKLTYKLVLVPKLV